MKQIEKLIKYNLLTRRDCVCNLYTIFALIRKIIENSKLLNRRLENMRWVFF